MKVFLVALTAATTCLAAKHPTSGSGIAPYEYGCVDPSTKDYSFCNTSMSIVDRSRAFVAAIDLGNLTARMNSFASADIPELNVSGVCPIVV